MIQIIYIIERKSLDDAVVFALLSSCFSVVIVIVTYFFTKQIEFNQTSLRLKVQFNVTDKYDTDIMHFNRQKGYRQRLTKHMANELGVMTEKIEIYAIIETHHGCIIYVAYGMNAAAATLTTPHQKQNTTSDSNNDNKNNVTKMHGLNCVSGKLDAETHKSVLKMFEIACLESSKSINDALIPNVIKRVWKLSIVPKVTVHAMSEYNQRMSVFVTQKNRKSVAKRMSLNGIKEELQDENEDEQEDNLLNRSNIRASSTIVVDTAALQNDCSAS